MKLLKKISIALLTVVLLPVGVELVIQLVGDPRKEELTAQAKELPSYWALAGAGVLVPADRALRFQLQPGFAATVGGIDYRVNELGLRGGPLARAKPAGVRRVLLVGDSYAFGLGVSEADSLPTQLQAQLQMRLAGDAAAAPAAVEVVNFGVPAYHTGQELALLDELGFSLAPDLVVLLYYPNDNVEAALTLAPSLHALYVDELPLPYSWKAFLSRSYLYSRVAKLDANRRDARGEFDARGERNWPATTARLRALAAGCRERHVAFLLAPLPELSNRVELNDDQSAVAVDHARVLALAAADGWPCVDLRAGLRQRVRAIEKYFLSLKPPDSHLNAEGYRVLAELLAPEAARLLTGGK